MARGSIFENWFSILPGQTDTKTTLLLYRDKHKNNTFGITKKNEKIKNKNVSTKYDKT